MGKFDEYLAEIEKVRQALDLRIVGQDDLKDSLINCLLAGGLTREENSHILLRSVPGLGKTVAAKVFARAFSVEFRRVQFKIDEMPKDFFFRFEQNPESRVWVRHKGAIFTNILLADEINRAHPDTHAGLLESMAEGQFTEQGQTLPLPRPFMVIGTFNPIEQRGTYGFIEALKDRFTMQIDIPYPTRQEARKIQNMHEKGLFRESDPVMDAPKVFELRKVIQEQVEVPERVQKIIEECIEASRPENNPELRGKVKLGLSPRGNVWLPRVAKVVAFRENRHFVLPRDVKKIAGRVLMHRIILSDELTVGSDAQDLEREIQHVIWKIIEKAFAYAKT